MFKKINKTHDVAENAAKLPVQASAVSGGEWGQYYETNKEKISKQFFDIVNSCLYNYKCKNCGTVFGHPGDPPLPYEEALAHVRECTYVSSDMPTWHF